MNLKETMTRDEAQEYANYLCDHFGIEHPTIAFGFLTNAYGSVNLDIIPPVMTLNSMMLFFEMLGTPHKPIEFVIIHEVAHILDFSRRGMSGHDLGFAKALLDVVQFAQAEDIYIWDEIGHILDHAGSAYLSEKGYQVQWDAYKAVLVER